MPSTAHLHRFTLTDAGDPDFDEFQSPVCVDHLSDSNPGLRRSIPCSKVVAMTINGYSVIGFSTGTAQADSFAATDPATGNTLPGRFYSASAQEVSKAAELAGAAFSSFSIAAPVKRAEFLDCAARKIEGAAEILVPRVMAETALPEMRVRGELGRTTGQLRLFAELLREGSWVDARIERALPDRQPLPKPDVRSLMEPLGPVTVFCASNFPLAFSVAGGDTASAFAAGCPVLVSAHHAHPGTAELVGHCLVEAVKECGLPEGVFSLLQGPGRTVGAQLVADPHVKAVGFTGSRTGGQALMKIAASRPEPIPVYAEMSSINPSVFLPGAVEERAEELAQGLTGSLCLGVGQFCTNPGLVFLEKGRGATEFFEALQAILQQVSPAVMLTEGIWKSYGDGVTGKSGQDGVKSLFIGEASGGCEAVPAVFVVEVQTFLENEILQEETFGPSTLLVTYEDKSQLLEALRSLEGQLTGSIHASDRDMPLDSDIVETLKSKVGRLLFNQYPTGVEVCHAMVHGGPYPSTSDGRSTSVGTMAIFRFCRPICYQNFPEEALPEALKNENPLGVWRLVDGLRTQNPV
jgi:NADP-dependent aldehyde dehydrogenase